MFAKNIVHKYAISSQAKKKLESLAIEYSKVLYGELRREGGDVANEETYNCIFNEFLDVWGAAFKRALKEEVYKI